MATSINLEDKSSKSEVVKVDKLIQRKIHLFLDVGAEKLKELILSSLVFSKSRYRGGVSRGEAKRRKRSGSVRL